MNDMNPIDHAIDTLDRIAVKVDKLIEHYHAKANQKAGRGDHNHATKDTTSPKAKG